MQGWMLNCLTYAIYFLNSYILTVITRQSDMLTCWLKMSHFLRYVMESYSEYMSTKLNTQSYKYSMAIGQLTWFQCYIAHEWNIWIFNGSLMVQNKHIADCIKYTTTYMQFAIYTWYFAYSREVDSQNGMKICLHVHTLHNARYLHVPITCVLRMQACMVTSTYNGCSKNLCCISIVTMVNYNMHVTNPIIQHVFKHVL